MAEIRDPSPEEITLDVCELRTYALISIGTWHVIKFFLKELKPVNIWDIEPEDCQCDICTEDFTADFHCAVRLPCNHIFGKTCIESWLRPYVSSEACSGQEFPSWGANSCPKCRRVFFPPHKIFGVIDNLADIEIRIRYFDMVYAHIGITLSQQEREAREDLLQYLGSYSARHLDTYYPYLDFDSVKLSNTLWAQRRLLYFCSVLKFENLIPAQEYLRQRLEDIGRHGFPGDVRLWRNIHGELFYAAREDPETTEEIELLDEADDDTEKM